MRRLICFLYLLLPLSVEAQEKKYVEDIYVRVPYAYGVDEGIIKALKSGKTTFKVPEGVRVKDGKVELRFARVTGGPNNSEIQEVWQSIENERTTLGIWFRDDVVYETITECYYIREAFYKEIKPFLPHFHKGRLEFFLRDGIDAQKAERDNPDHWDVYVWDATDGIWRYPTHLYPVSKEDKTAEKHNLFAKKPRDEEQVGVLVEMLKAKEERYQAFRIAKYKKNKK